MKVVLHKQVYKEFKTHTVNTTLCNRMSNKGDDRNVADTDAEVTCKFCLARLKGASVK
jgi:hypothetical protein